MDLDSLNYFLGIEVLHVTYGVLLHQRKFILDLLAEFHSSECSHVTCPHVLNVKLKAGVGDPLPKPEEYRSLHLSQFMQQLCVPYMKDALHLLKYLRGTSEFGIFFYHSPDLSLQVYCDSDWGSCPDSRRSISGF
ncbi:PREDICTED: uncharacterized protein LOC109239460 [Nicotiana attenuata]|uniref:uncharacterized protein LOC109239460 n=1 Tax=Nicotiana attenuata TaxID=49451 RepID=UPI0009054055|nr:PREDICTED: uncharacterized protein LOC109239460 [Nicotiana attenuata]